ncbi:PIN-like domain-containing protein [Jannaschia donghaensis]|uniref:PIN like domain-containing protein n=1 Tax=Jannaschia donghaensis TaxID=420998 RepID=A0A0M6YGY9_9RHOB|nr:PIN domain-containing protein [Jannaschia donghaensis]CTQ48763.1 hypothetical protein JDO7802_00768 [Jannaschia donghaensis]
MKGLFPQYDPGSPTDFKRVWDEALFVFDTNVLLNLYRYHSSTRDQLLDAIGKLSDRIWIPHHVALEFQRKRLIVIADQNKRFSEVRNLISKTQEKIQSDLGELQLERRHSLIDPAPLIEGISQVAENFLEKLNVIEGNQQTLNGKDTLKEKIEQLFENRVGSPMPNQESVEALYKKAENRYAKEIPPGYLDQNKSKDGLDHFIHGGIEYKSRYGDYLIWHQILEYAKQNDTETLVFVTDDAKDDWWLKIKMDGPKTIGPRPELVEEALLEGNISSFHMYKPEGFLRHTKDHLKAEVSKETLDEVRNVSRVRVEGARSANKAFQRHEIVERSVYHWLRNRFESIEPNFGSGFPDFTAKIKTKTIGFEVKIVLDPKRTLNSYRRLLEKAHYEVRAGPFDMITFVWVTLDEMAAKKLYDRLLHTTIGEKTRKVRNLIGVVDLEEEDPSFTMVVDFSMGDTFDESPPPEDIFG